MDKITFSNDAEPGLSAEILGQIQDNIEEAIYGDSAGWKTLSLNSNFNAYNSNSNNIPKCKKAGNVVELMGIVAPASAISGSLTEYEITTLPEGYRPVKTIYRICQGSTRNIWLLTINSSGSVTFSRYGTSSYANCPTTAWLPFDVCFLAS